MTPFSPPDVREYLLAARRDPQKVDAAWAILQGLPLFKRAPKTYITRSDMGRCSREAWAEIHGLYDTPDANYGARDAGTMLGALRAALLKVEIEARHDDVRCLLENEAAFSGVSGHADLSVYAIEGGACLWLWETKNTKAFAARPPHEPGKDPAKTPANTQHILQAVCGALAEGAPEVMVSTFSAGDTDTDPKASDHSEYDVDSWRGFVAAEIDRLKVAERDEMPEADPQKPYSCSGCRYGACQYNTNPLKPQVDLTALLTASLEAV